jgi:hypothetical protein
MKRKREDKKIKSHKGLFDRLKDSLREPIDILFTSTKHQVLLADTAILNIQETKLLTIL